MVMVLPKWKKDRGTRGYGRGQSQVEDHESSVCFKICALFSFISSFFNFSSSFYHNYRILNNLAGTAQALRAACQTR